MNEKSIKILTHLIGWLAFIILPLNFFIKKPDHPEPNLSSPFFITINILLGILLIGFFYLNFYVLSPRLYLKKKIVLYLLSALISLIIISILTIIILYFTIPPPPGAPPMPNPIFLNILFRFLIVFGLSSGISSFYYWKNLEVEKSKAEVSLLKSQINPHFLFNTLNSIYALSIKKSNSTPDAIIQLSNMMRYVTSEANQELVSLDQELKYINNYINLQKLRLTSKVKIEANMPKSNLQLQIAPLLIIPFIENAFKYGVNTEEDCKISININVVENKIHLLIENKKVKTNANQDEKLGLGIANTTKRLQLLYSNKHNLEIIDKTNTFTVDLKLTLS